MRVLGRWFCRLTVAAATLMAPSTVAALQAPGVAALEAIRLSVHPQLPAYPTARSPHLSFDGLRLDLQAEQRYYRRAGVGLGAGLTLGAVAFTGVLTSGSGNACTGSGNYLEICRGTYIGGTALSGGLGALIGGLIRREAPSGRARSVLLGSAMGAVIPFVLSLPVCEQSDPGNPGALCGVHGMTNPGITMASAAAGALVAYLLGRGSDQRVSYVDAPVSTPLMGAALEIRLAPLPWGPD